MGTRAPAGTLYALFFVIQGVEKMDEQKQEDMTSETDTPPAEGQDLTPKEIALTKMVEELKENYKKLTESYKKVKIDNETLSLKIGIGTPEEDPLRAYSKYHNVKER